MSARAVPIPVSTASCSLRSSSTNARDRSPVMARRFRPAPPTAPSSVAATFRASRGRPRSIRLAWPASSSRAASASSPVSTRTPRSWSAVTPRPETRGSGSCSETTHRATPASASALAQGGVFPKWEHGSSVTYAVAPRASDPASASASASAWGRPPGAVRPEAAIRPSWTRTHATGGLGQEFPSERLARCKHRAIQRRSALEEDGGAVNPCLPGAATVPAVPRSRRRSGSSCRPTRSGRRKPCRTARGWT